MYFDTSSIGVPSLSGRIGTEKATGRRTALQVPYLTMGYRIFFDWVRALEAVEKSDKLSNTT